MNKPIAVDAMGGDHAPRAPVEAAWRAAQSGQPVTLVGNLQLLEATLQRLGPRPAALTLVEADEVIGMDEAPSQSVRKKPGASVNIAVREVAEGRAKAMVSAGNSGAVMAAGLFHAGRIPGVQRPAIAAAVPSRMQPTVLLDLGANVDPTATQLAQFAVMGHAYAQTVLARPNPRVAILCNGSEEAKGNALTRGAHALLERSDINYRGYCEGRDVFQGEIDVIVTDGFTGNVVLKTLEGLVDIVRHLFERELTGNLLAGAGALLMRKILGKVQRKLDYEQAGGAPLLGLKESCLVAHGTSSVTALENAIRAADKLVQTGLVRAIEDAIAQHERLWSSS